MPEAVLFRTDWFTPHIPLWNNLLATYKDQPALQFLEIGSFEGRSAVWLLENVLTHATAHLTCVDRFTEAMTLPADHTLANIETTFNLWESFNHNIAAYREKVTVIRGRSQEVLRELPLYTYDFVYIDGSHAAVDTLEDSILAFRMLKIGGMMLWADYRLWEYYKLPETDLAHPKYAIDVFMNVFGHKLEVIYQGYQIAVQKINH